MLLAYGVEEERSVFQGEFRCIFNKTTWGNLSDSDVFNNS